MRLTSPSVIHALCEKYGFSLSKNYGQNFLVNAGICPKICDAAGIDATSNVLEIGPGFGTLTQEIAQRARRVVALEVDARLLPVLDETLADYPNAAVVHADVLKADLATLMAERFDGPATVCANLPYNITSPIVMRLLEEELPIASITVMVQKEAAERLCAAPPSRAAGAISYAVHYYAQPKMQFVVNPGSFFPPPKVKSAVITLAKRPQRALQQAPEREKRLFRLVRAAFSQRRKTLLNAASAALPLPKEALAQAIAAAGLAPAVRPEQLSLQQFIELEAALASSDF